LPILAQCPTITAGQSVTVTFPVTVDVGLPHGTAITNTAAVTSTEVVIPQTGSKSITVQAPDLALTKVVDDDTPNPGQLITYTVVVANNGGQNATDALITDTWKPTNALTVAGPIIIDPPTAGTTGTLPYTLAHGVTITAGQSVTVTFPVTVNASLVGGTVITNTAAVTCSQGVADIDVLTTTVARPEPNWDKLVYVNGTLIITRPVVVRANDAISIVDRVLVTYTVPVTFTLVETWTGSLNYKDCISDTGSVTTTANSLTWDVDGITPTVRYAITKTFVVTGGLWTYDFVTETLDVETADPQLPTKVLTFAHGCEPVTSVGFAWVPYPSPQPGDLVTFTAIYTPSYATTPITYVWDISGTLRKNNPVYHTFLYSDTYPVIVTATNPCGGPPVTATQNVMVSGTTFVPTYDVELAPATDTDSGDPTTDVVYTLWLTNTGDAADTFNLSKAGDDWTANVTPGSVNLPPTGTHQITVTVTIPPGAQPGGSDTVTVTATSQLSPTISDSSVLTTTALRPEPAWDKQVYVNGVPATTSPITVVASDTIQIVDRVWVTYTPNVTFTLVETWTNSLEPPTVISDVGGVVMGAHVLTWTAVNVAPNTWHAITKTFNVTDTDWVNDDYVTETLWVEDAGSQLPTRVLTFAHGCEPVTEVGFDWSPFIPQPGDLVTFTATLTPSYATPPVTCTWDISGTPWSGNPVYHTFLYSDTYTVFVTATNPCDGPVVMSHTVVVSGTPFTPVYSVTLTAIPTDTKSGDPGSDVVYTLWVTNTGNMYDTFDLSRAGNAWATIMTPSSINNLPPTGTHQITITVTVTDTAQCGDSDTVVITATSRLSPTVSDSSVLTTSANTIHGVEMTPPTDGQNGAPGETVTYTLRVTNTGNCTDTFTVSRMGAGWATTISPTTSFTLSAKAGQDVQVAVTISPTAASGAQDVATIRAAGTGVNATTVLTTTASTARGVEITPSTNAKSDDPGETVTYTLWVTNTGNDTDAFTVTVSDDVWLTTISITETGNLAAGVGTSVVVTVTVPTGAQCTDSDTITVTAISQGDGATSDSSVLTTSADPIYGVGMTPPTAAQSGDPGETVTYTLRVTNTGNCSDTFNVTASGNAWTTVVDPITFTLAAGVGIDVDVQVTITDTATPGQNDTVTVTATSQGDISKSASSVLTTSANRVYNVEVSPSADAKSGDPGTTVPYTLWVTNTGNDTDAFTVTVSGDVWLTTISITETGNLAAGDDISVVVTVTVLAGAQCGDSDIITVTATSHGDGTTSDNSVLTTSADAVSGVEMTPPTDTRNGNPGETVTYTLRVTNTGNCTDTFTLGVVGDDWTTNAPTPIGPLAVGAGADVEVTVDIPPGALRGDSDVVTITATSQGDGTTSDSSVLTTWANTVYGVNMTPTVAAQSGDPGETVTYTLRVTNTGNYTDAFTLSVDGADWTTNFPAPGASLAAGAGMDVIGTVDVPLTAKCGDSDTITVTIASTGSPTKSASSVLTTTANPVYSVTMDVSIAAQRGNPGETVTYTLRVTNTGNCADTFDIGVVGDDWTTNAPTPIGPLAAGAGADVEVTVDILPSALCGDSDVVTITATSQGDSLIGDFSVLTTTANAVYGVTVDPSTDGQIGDPGATVTYTLRMTNTGNCTDTFNVGVSGDDWTTNAPLSIGPLAAGVGADVDVTVDIPPSACCNDSDTVTVTATSQHDGSESDSSVLTTLVFEPLTGASFTFTPTNPLADEVITFTGIVTPSNATPPITYTWGFSGSTDSGKVVTHTWGFSGTYSVMMTATNSCPSQETATRDVIVTGEPDITVNPLSLSAMLNPGDATTRTLTIRNAPTATANLNWNLAENPAVTWLDEAPDSGTVPPAGNNTVNVVFTAGLVTGTYTTTLQVSSNDPDEPQVAVSVTLVVTTACIKVDGAEFAYAPPAPQAGGVITFTGSVTRGTEPIIYTWDFGGGVTATGRIVTHTWGFSGTYSVVMTATNACGEDTETHDVPVTGAPDITVDPLSLSVLLEIGGSTTRILTITNTSTATANLNWSLAEIPAVAWLSEAPGSGTALQGESDTVGVNFTANVGAGTHNTILRVNSNDPDEPQVDVNVTLIVTSCVPVSDADFTWSADPLVDETVTFTGTVNAASSTPIQYTWDFGDGSAPVQSGWEWDTTYVVAHTYAVSDTYTVVMTATNCGGASVATHDIVVIGEPDISVAPLSLSAVLNPGQNPGQTTPREFTIGNGSGATTNLIWGLAEIPARDWLSEVPVSGVISPSESSDVQATFNSVGLAAGVYTDTLRVSSNDLDDPVVDVNVTLVVTTACIPIEGADFDFAPKGVITAGDTVVFTGSVMQGRLPLIYTWDFGDGTPEEQYVENTTTRGTVVTHLYTGDAGGYTVRMTVSNCGGEATVSKRIGTHVVYLPLVVRNHTPPRPAFITDLTSDSPVVLGEAMHFTATVEGSEPITYTWDFDGAGSGSGTDGATPAYTYDVTGTYTVTLDVDNGYGTPDSSSIQVTVNPSCTQVSIGSLTGDDLVAPGELTYFTATVEGTQPITYAWDFGDGTPEQIDVGLDIISHTYADTGVYYVTLVVTNACGTDDNTGDPLRVIVMSSAAGANSLFTPSTPPVSEITTLTSGIIPSNAVAAYAWNDGGRRRQ